MGKSKDKKAKQGKDLAPKEVGSAGCSPTGRLFLKVVFCPCILVWKAFVAYFVACCGTYLTRIGRKLACGICVCCNWTYKDSKFPANTAAIGAWQGRTPSQIEEEVEWVRIKDIVTTSDEGAKKTSGGGTKGAKLFYGKVNPSEICQGQVGDCWLMSALACLTKIDNGIQRAFLTREYNAYGKYKLLLYDKRKDKFVKVVVDDWIPCKKGTKVPVFAQPSGGGKGAWVLILEKAMAKHLGSYSALDGGSVLWAFQTLTGNYCFKLRLEGRDGQTWRRLDLVTPKAGERGVALLAPSEDVLSHKETFSAIRFYTKKKSIIAASSGEGNDSEQVHGIVQGHAYSVTRAKEVEGFKMIELRNPWGSFEWNGDWSDHSSKWKEHPKVAEKLDFKPSDDGSFWMEFSDFLMHFRNLDFCFRTTGWDDLVIDLHEEHLVCGPTIGCLEGCGDFWCCCKGVRALFCAQKKQAFMKAPTGCCACCV